MFYHATFSYSETASHWVICEDVSHWSRSQWRMPLLSEVVYGLLLIQGAPVDQSAGSVWGFHLNTTPGYVTTCWSVMIKVVRSASLTASADGNHLGLRVDYWINAVENSHWMIKKSRVCREEKRWAKQSLQHRNRNKSNSFVHRPQDNFIGTHCRQLPWTPL